MTVANVEYELEQAGIMDRIAGDPFAPIHYVQSIHPNASDSGRGVRANAPLRTFARAVAIASNDARILIGPGHVETLTATLTLAQNGLTIIGYGGPTRKPTITVGGTDVASSIYLTGNNNRFFNVMFTAGLDALTTIVLVKFSAFGCVFEDCDLSTSTIGVQPVSGITVQAEETIIRRLRIRSLVGFANAGCSQAILLDDGAADFVTIDDCELRGNFSVANIATTAVTLQNLQIRNCRLINLNATSNVNISIGAAAISGFIVGCHCRNATDANTAWITLGAGAVMSLGENYGVNDNNETGKLIGAVSV